MTSLGVGTYLHIPVKVHWTFGLVLLYITYIGVAEGLSLPQTMWFGAYVGVLFFCVLLHEYGHALMARRYGVKTVDIIILPIGGLARLERLPKKPSQELAVAIAGPLVNVAIAVCLAIITLVLYDTESLLSATLDMTQLSDPKVFLTAAIAVNIVLFLFNLIPAFPMDGGRILRALLATRLTRLIATRVATYIGQFIAVCFIGLSFYFGAPSWGFVGLFVIYTARNEYRSVRQEHLLDYTSAGSVATPDYTVLDPSSSYSSNDLRQTGTSAYKVVLKGSLANLDDLRILTNHTSYKGITDKPAKDLYDIDSQTLPLLDENATIRQVLELMQSSQTAVIGITKNGQQLIGVIDRHVLSTL